MDAPGTRSAARLSTHRREYERRVYRVMDYVQAHLDEDLTLEKLAGVAAFSPFHFHRVFAAIAGETLSDFIRRVRLERAASGLAIMLTIGIGHDAPKIAPADKLRYDACVVVDQSFKPDRFVTIADLPGGKHAVAAAPSRSCCPA